MKLEKDVLITGAAGFIGSHLGNRLASLGAAVRGMDNGFHPSGAPTSFPVESGDVRFPEFLAMRVRNADAVVHLAAAINVDFSHVLPEAAFEINMEGTINVLEACRRLDKELVFASTSEIYGTVQDTRCVDGTWHGDRAIGEDHPLDGQSPYAASKIAADRACKAWADTYGMRVNVVRLFNTYGPWQASDGYGGVIAKFTEQALGGRALTIYGSGDQRRDYLWVDDACAAFELALRKRFDGPVNFGTGTTVSIRDLVPMVGELAGVPYKWTFERPRAGEVDCLRADASKARELGWAPTTVFADGLKRYVAWAKEDGR